jgi:hypothetical protein
MKVDVCPAGRFSRRGGLTTLVLPGEGFDFAGFSSVSLFPFIRGAFR